jgi:hemoglobin-like flavoprotein
MADRPMECLMTPAQKKLVQTSWGQVVPIADTAAAMFYIRLFEIDPTTRALFSATNMAQHRKKLVQMLAMAVSGLDRLGALVSMVEDLGRRHAGYGVKNEHYDFVGAALLWTLEQSLGSAWNAETKAAWTDFYVLLSGVMRRAQAAATAAAA